MVSPLLSLESLRVGSGKDDWAFFPGAKNKVLLSTPKDEWGRLTAFALCALSNVDPVLFR